MEIVRTPLYGRLARALADLEKSREGAPVKLDPARNEEQVNRLRPIPWVWAGTGKADGRVRMFPAGQNHQLGLELTVFFDGAFTTRVSHGLRGVVILKEGPRAAEVLPVLVYDDEHLRKITVPGISAPLDADDVRRLSHAMSVYLRQ